MQIEYLVRNHSKLFHMAEDGSWPSIKKHGLLSTSSLLSTWGYSEKEKEEICRKHRPSSVTIESEKLGKAVLRDQKAINPTNLQSCLSDITIEEWYCLLNNKVFFWPDWQNLKWFLEARAYFNKPHVVITIDTARLLAKYTQYITLSSINSGSTYPKQNSLNPEPRGINTFKNIPAYQYIKFKELAVENGVQNITDVAISVDRFISRTKGVEPEKIEALWYNN